MGSSRPSGFCRICLTHGPLSYEHVPPRKAFNDHPALLLTFQKLVKGKSLDEVLSSKGKVLQRGAGDYTLCERCNNFTGSKYGPAYVDFAYQALAIAQSSASCGGISLPFRIAHLGVLKEVVAMFLSANSPGFAHKHAYLPRFVLNPHATGMSPRYRFYAFVTRGALGGKIGLVGRTSLSSSSQNLFYSTISHPPLGFVMTVDSHWDGPAFQDITYFAQCSGTWWEEPWTYKREVWLRMPIMGRSTHPLYFTDYDNPPKSDSDQDPDPNLTAEVMRASINAGRSQFERLA